MSLRSSDVASAAPAASTAPLSLDADTQDAAAASASSAVAAAYACVTSDGQDVSVPLSVATQVSYFRVLFQEDKFAPVEQDSQGRYLLDSALQQPYLGVVLAYVQHPEQLQLLLTKLPRAAEFMRVLRLMDFFGMPKPAAADEELPALLLALKDVKDEHNKICRGVWEFHSARNGRVTARNAAVALCVALATDTLALQNARVRMLVFNSFTFILGHLRTFRRRLRTHAFKLLEARCASVFTQKQWAQLNKWVPRGRHLNSDSETDSEEEEERNAYDSDYYSD